MLTGHLGNSGVRAVNIGFPMLTGWRYWDIGTVVVLTEVCLCQMDTVTVGIVVVLTEVCLCQRDTFEGQMPRVGKGTSGPGILGILAELGDLLTAITLLENVEILKVGGVLEVHE